MNRRIAFYGGTFDPVHSGHMDIARAVIGQFGLDEFVFVPAFHAPHKKRRKPTSAFHRFAMLCEASDAIDQTSVSTLEVEAPDRPYTIETIAQIKLSFPDDIVFLVIGADSWEEITTWREWESVLSSIDVIVMTRPGYDVGTDHVTEEIRERIVDIRGQKKPGFGLNRKHIYVTDLVNKDISSTEIRASIRAGNDDWRSKVSPDVALHIMKYDLYGKERVSSKNFRDLDRKEN